MVSINFIAKRIKVILAKGLLFAAWRVNERSSNSPLPFPADPLKSLPVLRADIHARPAGESCTPLNVRAFTTAPINL